MDIIYIFIPIILMFVSQTYIKSTYSKYLNVKSKKNLTGYDVATEMLIKNEINDVKVEKINGTLTDHFDPKKKVVRLSEEVYSGTSIAVLSIAAHEVGHVIQHSKGYLPIKIRSALVPVVNFSSKLGYLIFIIGMIATILNLAYLGLALMAMALLFQLVTLPVEFDASKRAIKSLYEGKMILEEERSGVSSMLKSAAFTYVASFFVTMLEMLRLLSLIRGRD